MREILFRGKRADNGEWFEGSIIKAKGSFSDEPEAVYYIAPFTPCYTDIKKIIPETVGQYTGLTDKNGKRIFEGDIVSTDIARPYLVVEFRDGCFMFNCNDGGEDYYDIMLPILKEPQTIYGYGEVIGNIHDNSELMKR